MLYNPQANQLVSDNKDFFFGTIVSSDAATYCVQVAPSCDWLPSLMTGIPLASVMANMLGVKECVLPQPGSKAFCYRKDAAACLILGIIPSSNEVNLTQTFHSRSTLGAGDGNSCENNIQGYALNDGSAAFSKLNIANVNRPTDVVEGEYVLANEFGVMLGLFQQFATLKASELAQVQAFIFDDLVRIVSHNFEHFTCMGSSKVFQDNTDLSQEINLTHDAIEASGRPNTINAPEPVFKFTGQSSIDDSADFVELTNEKQLAIDRFKGFVGALGVFFHFIFVKPNDSQLRVANSEPSLIFDRGLASFKLGLDGAIALRSLNSLAFEKTNWIRVPQRITPVEEKADETKEPPINYAFDKQVTSENLPLLYFLQLRDYLAYTLEGDGYRQFAGSPKFELNNDFVNETPISENTQLTPNRTSSYYPKSSGFYLMPNGGVMIKDAWGSALVMEGGNIYLQPAKDLVMQPLRNMVGKVGGNIAVAARKIKTGSRNEGRSQNLRPYRCI